jgi:hypothetical protein
MIIVTCIRSCAPFATYCYFICCDEDPEMVKSLLIVVFMVICCYCCYCCYSNCIMIYDDAADGFLLGVLFLFLLLLFGKKTIGRRKH